MIATPVVVDPTSLLRPDEPIRSQGLHLSTIIRSMLVDLDPVKYDPGKPMDLLRIEAGFAFERALEQGLSKAFPQLHTHPGEFWIDGIVCSPDGYDLETLTVHELKCTWKSSNYPIEDRRFWHWLVQIKGYCSALNTLSAVLWVFFVNGDYRNSGPQLKRWDLTFDALELAENWQMLCNHAKARGLL